MDPKHNFGPGTRVRLRDGSLGTVFSYTPFPSTAGPLVLVHLDNGEDRAVHTHVLEPL